MASEKLTANDIERLNGPAIDLMAHTRPSESFIKALEALINEHSQEGGSDTPDFILANYLASCLQAYNVAVDHREQWYGRQLEKRSERPHLIVNLNNED